ncbi:MAG: hypothetical protein OXU30_11090 [Gammaproteobacteria bacterium]|nr:hypothetical protein [Gammaproteobacteria bacterium]MDD9894270.1 hypothetical protein [Gammaproteobacteria bacterium]
MKNYLLILLLALLLSHCGEDSQPARQINEPISNVDSFRMGNAEIRQDIINALIEEGIEHWENEDGSIGFYSKDTERVDAIGFFAIGAYAARQ